MLIEGFLLGLSTGTYCAMTCIPLGLPVLVSEIGTFGQNARRVGLFMLGRLLSYIAIGFFLGALGQYALGYLDPAIAHTLSAVSWTLAGALLTLAGAMRNFPRMKLCVAAGRWWKPGRASFLLGLFAGLSLCPPFFAAAARVFGNGGSPDALEASLRGAFYFLFFYLGTSVYLLPLFLVGFLGSERVSKMKRRLEQVARSAMLLLGVYFMVIEGVLGFVR